MLNSRSYHPEVKETVRHFQNNISRHATTHLHFQVDLTGILGNPKIGVFIIYTYICLVPILSTDLYRPFIKRCSPINRTVGTILMVLSKPPYGCHDRFHSIFHMPNTLTKVNVICICLFLYNHIELYVNKILRSCTFIINMIKGFHSDCIYTSCPNFIEMG